MGAIDSRKADEPANPVPLGLIDATLKVWQVGTQAHWFTTAGTSMNPLIYDGDSVLVSHNLADVRRGDIVVFRRGETVIAHRVIHAPRDIGGQQTLMTKGDNALRFDEPVALPIIIGKVIALKRDGRHVRLDTRWWQLIGWLIAIVTAGVAGVYASARTVKRRHVGLLSIPWVARARRFASGALVRVIRVTQVQFPKH